jgi:hypothetical protein
MIIFLPSVKKICWFLTIYSTFFKIYSQLTFSTNTTMTNSPFSTSKMQYYPSNKSLVNMQILTIEFHHIHNYKIHYIFEDGNYKTSYSSGKESTKNSPSVQVYEGLFAILTYKLIWIILVMFQCKLRWKMLLSLVS